MTGRVPDLLSTTGRWFAGWDLLSRESRPDDWKKIHSDAGAADERMEAETPWEPCPADLCRHLAGFL